MVVRVFGWLHDVVGIAIAGFDLNHLRTIAAFSQLVEPDIFQDGEEPALDVAIRSQPPHGLHGADVGFLYQVFCLCVVARHDQSVPVQPVDILGVPPVRIARSIALR